MKACFMGLGYIGLPTAIIAAKHGVEVVGVDINPQDETLVRVSAVGAIADRVADTVKIAVQVNGKLRGEVEVAKDADQATVERLALEQANVARFTDGKEIVKKIYVPGKILNLVVK